MLSLRYPKLLEYRSIVLVGAVLPDLGNFTMLMGKAGSYISPYFIPLKTPLGILPFLIFLSLVVRGKFRKITFGLLSLGAYLHIAGDSLIKTLWGKVMPFFPFSFELYGVGIFEQGGWLFPLIAGILAVTSTGLRRLSSNKPDLWV